MGSDFRDEHARVSEVVCDINRTLVDATSRADIEAGVCGTLAGSDAYAFAWIGDYDRQTDEIRPRAEAGIESDYLETISIDVHAQPDRRGPTASAARTGDVHAVQNIRDDPAYEPWREAALDHGFESSAAVPVTDGNDRYGILNVYADRPEAFDETERQLLSELGETIATAISGVQARQELEAQKQQYERLTDRISDAFFAVDTDWRITYWSERMAARTDTPADAVTGAVLWDAFPALIDTTIEQEYRTAMETQEQRSFETYLGDPYDYWVEIDVYPDDNGLSVFSRDITDRRERERAIETIHDRTRSLMQTETAAATAQVAVDTAHEVLDAQLCGFHLLSADGRSLDPVAHVDTVRETLDDPPRYDRDDDGQPSQVVWDAFEGGTPRVIDDTRTVDGLAEVTPTRSGIIHPLDDHGVFIVSSTEPHAFDETDKALLDLLVTSLLTALDRVEHEQALRETKGTLESIIDASPDPIVMVDENRRVSLWNPAAEEVFGWEAEEVLGEPLPVIPDHKREEFEELMATLDEGGINRAIETVRCRKDGESVDVSVSSMRVETGDHATGYVSIFRDIRQRKDYERRLEEQRDSLQILNQMVRHDIRNDLQVIQTYAGLLGDYVDESGQEYVDNILSNARGAVALTQTARDLAEAMLDSGDDPEPISLGGTLRGQLDEIRASFPDAIVTTAGPVPSLKVYADEMLGSVFRNVISNAIVHNDTEVPAVTVAVTELDDRVRVSVADNGPGIPDDQKAEVFGRGKKGMESQGTGIGLYLVDTLVDQYDGDVWVEDRAAADLDATGLEGSTGSVFHIELRLA